MPKVGTPVGVLVGLESSGKSSLAAALTGNAGRSRANFRGSTVAIQRHVSPGVTLVDTPGLIRIMIFPTCSAASTPFCKLITVVSGLIIDIICLAASIDE